TIATSGAYTEADPDEVRRVLNWESERMAARLGPCLVFPIFDAQGRPTGRARLKPDRPRQDAKRKRTIKYEAPRRRPPDVYFPPLPALREALADPARPVVILEGEKKSLAGCQDGVACIALTGVWNFGAPRPKGADGSRPPMALRPEL